MPPLLADAIPSDPSRRRPNHRRYWMSLYRRDVTAAEAMVEQAMQAWRGSQIYLRLFEPALQLSGTLWASGTIRVEDEHFITYHTTRLMRRVRRQFVPPVTDGPLALAGGVEQESHLVGLRMVCDFLKTANWRIHWLSSTDRAVVTAAAEQMRPDAVLLSIGQAQGVVPATRLIADLRRHRTGGVIAVGGRYINMNPSLARDLDADLTAPNALAALRELRHRAHPHP